MNTIYIYMHMYITSIEALNIPIYVQISSFVRGDVFVHETTVTDGFRGH